MKTNLFITFSFCICFSVFGQFVQQGNYQNLLNPATNGLYHEHELNLGNYAFGLPLSGTFQMSMASYSKFLQKSNIGLGINYQNKRYSGGLFRGIDDQEFKVGANKQFQLKERMIFSFGLASGVALNTQYTSVTVDSLSNALVSSKKPIFTSDVGIAFRWKRLNTNLSVNHFLNDRAKGLSNGKSLAVNVYSEYIFGKSDGFQFTPQIAYTHDINGFHTLFGNALLSYRSNYSLGVGMRSRDMWFVSVSALISKKFRIGYTYGTNLLINKVGPNLSFHEFNLALLLNKRNLF
jgi:hypothetical protein